MPATSLYDTDFVRWSDEQAEAIRQAAASGTNLALDWENIAEEIESLGKSQRSELRSRLGTVIEHLMKLEYSPSLEPRAGWIETIGRERLKIEELLEDNPSLRASLADRIDRAHDYAVKAAGLSLDRYGEATRERSQALERRRYTAEQVTGSWLPAPPPGP